MKNNIQFPIYAIFLLLTGCSKISINDNWKAIDYDVFTRTGYKVEFDSKSSGKNIPSNKLTVEKAIEYSLKMNPKLHAYFQELGIAKADLVQAGFYKNPDFFSSINFPNKKNDTSELSLGLSISISDIWQLPIRKQVSTYQLEIISLTIINTIINTIAEVEHAYANCNYWKYVAYWKKQIYEENLLLLESLKYRQQFGMQNDWEIYQLEAVTYQYKTNLLETLNELAISYSTLGMVMGQKPKLTTISLKPIIFANIPLCTYNALYHMAVKKPDIIAAEYNVMRFKSIIKLEHSRFINEFNAGISYAKDFENSKGTGPLFTITLPIFDQNQAQVARAQFGYKKAQQELRSKKLEITHLLNIAFFSYKTAQRKLISLQQAVKKQEEALSYAYHYFKSNQIKLPLVIQTRIMLFKEKLKLLKVHYELYSAYIDLKKITGNKLNSILTQQLSEIT